MKGVSDMEQDRVMVDETQVLEKLFKEKLT